MEYHCLGVSGYLQVIKPQVFRIAGGVQIPVVLLEVNRFNPTVAERRACKKTPARRSVCCSVASYVRGRNGCKEDMSSYRCHGEQPASAPGKHPALQPRLPFAVSVVILSEIITYRYAK